MDIKKLNIPTLDGPNWGQYITSLQVAAWIFDCYDVIWGEILTPNPTYDLLTKPMVPPAQASAANLATYNTMKMVWSKKNTQALGLMQATVSPVIWRDYNYHSAAKDLFNALEATFRKGGEHQLISKWSTWWKFNSLIQWICCPRYNNSRTITIESCWMAIVDFLKTWQPSCSAQVFPNHMNRPPSNTLTTSW